MAKIKVDTLIPGRAIHIFNMIEKKTFKRFSSVIECVDISNERYKANHTTLKTYAF